MSHLNKTIIVVLVLFLIIGCSQQSSDTDQFKEQIALSDAGFASLRALDWAKYASQIQPEGLEEFRAMVMPSIEKMVMASKGDSVNLLGKMFKSEELQGMPADSFFVEFMTLVTSLSPQIDSTFSGMTNKAIGAVAEGDSVVHVVVKTNLKLAGQNIDEMNIQTVVKSDDGWKLEASPKIIGMAQYFGQVLAPR